MKGASVKKVILIPFPHWSHLSFPKISSLTDPPSHFLTISPRFLTNIGCRNFSFNIWVVYDHLELDWCIFDQKWAKTRPLHFQIFQILNATDRRIVQWLMMTWNDWRGSVRGDGAAWLSKELNFRLWGSLRTPLELEPHHRPITLGKVIHKIRCC